MLDQALELLRAFGRLEREDFQQQLEILQGRFQEVDPAALLARAEIERHRARLQRLRGVTPELLEYP